MRTPRPRRIACEKYSSAFFGTVSATGRVETVKETVDGVGRATRSLGGALLERRIIVAREGSRGSPKAEGGGY